MTAGHVLPVRLPPAGREAHHPGDVDPATPELHAAWIKAVMLHMTVWTRPYLSADD
jgi:hypothetical protein